MRLVLSIAASAALVLGSVALVGCADMNTSGSPQRYQGDVDHFYGIEEDRDYYEDQDRIENDLDPGSDLWDEGPGRRDRDRDFDDDFDD